MHRPVLLTSCLPCMPAQADQLRVQTPAGTDINKVGIAPDVELQGQAQPPLEGAGFCKFAGPDEARTRLPDTVLYELRVLPGAWKLLF